MRPGLMFFQDGPHRPLSKGTSRPKAARDLAGVKLARALACMGSSMGRRQALLEETIVVQRGDRRAPHDGSPRDEFVETSAVGPAHE